MFVILRKEMAIIFPFGCAGVYLAVQPRYSQDMPVNLCINLGVGVERCEERQAKALEKALKESAKQEKNAPVIAQEARDAVKPKVEERIRVIREQIPAKSCSDDYPDGVQAIIREAATAAN